MKSTVSFLMVFVLSLLAVTVNAQSQQDSVKMLIKCDGTNKLMIVKNKLRHPVRTDRFVMTVQGDGGSEHEFVFQPVYGYVTSPGNPYPNALFHRNDYLHGVNMKFLEMDYQVFDMLGGLVRPAGSVYVDLNIDLSRVVGQGEVKISTANGEVIATIPVSQCTAEL